MMLSFLAIAEWVMNYEYLYVYMDIYTSLLTSLPKAETTKFTIEIIRSLGYY